MNSDNEKRNQESPEREMAEWLPTQRDNLFVSSDGGACLDPLGLTSMGEKRSSIGRWQLYAGGFLQAADRLVHGCRGMPYEDALIYPILNLYRHHLELELKYLVRYCKGGERFRDWLTKTHSLMELWNCMTQIYPRFGTWTSAESTEGCHRLLSEFDQHDRNSQSSRYPEDKHGKQTLLALETVDLQILKLGVHKISHYLSAVVEQLAEDRDWEEEVNSW